MKRIFIVHGWSGSSKRDWIPWLTKELLERGYAVEAFDMPFSYTPLVRLWMSHLKRKVGTIDKNTYFVGHSLGTRAIMMFLQSQDQKPGGVIFVGGFAGGHSYVTFPYNKIISSAAHFLIGPWLSYPMDFEKLRKLVPESVAILSDNDQFIPFDKNKQAFEERLGSRVVVLHDKRHFIYNEVGEKVPEILEEALKMLQ